MPKSSSRYGATAVAAELKLDVKLVPTACTAAMMTIAIPAAIRPYSMAVAPESLFKKRETNFVILGSRLKLHPEVHAIALGAVRERRTRYGMQLNEP